MNPSSTVIIGTYQQMKEIFRFYACFGALKRGFKADCRSIIGVDRCHLKGPHGGILLTAIGVDPNNNLFPIAYAVVNKECRVTWEWFLIILKHDLDIVKDYEFTFMSEKQKGLMKGWKRKIGESTLEDVAEQSVAVVGKRKIGKSTLEDVVEQSVAPETEQLTILPPLQVPTENEHCPKACVTQDEFEALPRAVGTSMSTAGLVAVPSFGGFGLEVKSSGLCLELKATLSLRSPVGLAAVPRGETHLDPP
ncbi:UNVERIFIED_CONTAM: hypothetical protein Scaly_1664000 [Sesamum calycinum]|uniref:MULE transposase domain-containing protein n=1 Tax=Sesamum calycinum TaxID=2727403 RepID=A0AAW2NUB7_9LAMI